MERDEPEPLLFEGIVLEEPSRQVDEAILARAKERLRAPGGWIGPAGPAAWIRLGLAASLVIGLMVLWPQRPSPVDRVELGAASARAPMEELRDLLAELDQINEMSELISPEKQLERQAIEEKIKFCLADLSALEEKLLRFDQGSLNEHQPKEVRI